MPNGILEVKQIKQLSADGGETVVDVENKTIDGVAIGSATPAAGSFTSVDATSASLDGAVTINESGADVDFRVEASGEANALFVEGSSGDVGIGNNNPSGTANPEAGNLVIGSTGTTRNGLTILGSELSTIAFGDSGDDNAGRITYSHSDDYMRFYTAGSQRMTIDSSGNVTISNLGTGTVYSSSGTLTNTNPSDLNLKENVVNVSYGLSEIKQLRPVEFDWVADEEDKHELGFIAQEVQPIIPDLVSTYDRIVNKETGETETGYGLESTQFIPVLVKAIQEQQVLIESQQAQIDALFARLDALENPPA